MKISAVLCVKNGDSYLGEAIHSILNQTLAEFELIIVVNCSTDSSYEVASSFNDPRITVLTSDICQLSYNLNLALSVATGKYIGRIDADDFAEIDRFKKMYEYCELHLIDVLGTSVSVINENGDSTGDMIVYPSHNDQIRARLPFNNPFAHPSVLIKTSCLKRVGGYLGGMYAQDYDLWLRLARDTSVIFANLTVPYTRYRVHSGQSKGNLESYANVSSYLLREAILQLSLKYLMGSIIYVFKTLNRRLRNRLY